MNVYHHKYKVYSIYYYYVLRKNIFLEIKELVEYSCFRNIKPFSRSITSRVVYCSLLYFTKDRGCELLTISWNCGFYVCKETILTLSTVCSFLPLSLAL